METPAHLFSDWYYWTPTVGSRLSRFDHLINIFGESPPSESFSESFSSDEPPEDFTHVCLSDLDVDFCEKLDVPKEVIDLFVDYADSSQPPSSQSTKPSSPSIGFAHLQTPVPLIPPLQITPNKSRRSCALTSDDIRTLRRKAANRDASFRYRQKMKVRSTQLKTELDLAFSSYQRARLAYEKTEQTLNVVQNLLISLLGLEV